MPTYEHKCFAENCGYKWDEIYPMSAKPPIKCPSCEKEGYVQRLISGGSGRGIVRLTGGDLRAQLMSDAGKARERARTDEKFRASIIGEQNYHDQQTKTENLTNELAKIGKKASSTKSSSKKSVAKRVSGK